jgi:hypothetical protein
MFSLEDHFNNPKYSYLDYYTKRIYIEYIKELSKLCLGREFDNYFPLYLLKTQEINKKIENWHWDKNIALEATNAFLDTVDPDFYIWVN